MGELFYITLVFCLLIENGTPATTVNPQPVNDPNTTVAGAGEASSAGAGAPVDVAKLGDAPDVSAGEQLQPNPSASNPGPSNTGGSQGDTPMSAASIIDFTGNTDRVSNTVDLGTSGIISEVAGAKPAANRPFVTLEQANADNDKLYLDPALCDGCSEEMTKQNYCFLSHAIDCRKYVQCSLQSKRWIAYNRMCGFGTFWSTRDNSCQFPDKANCENDFCRNPKLKTYDSGTDNCRTYWACNSLVSEPKCCAKYFSFQNGECKEDKNCTTECPEPCEKGSLEWYPDEKNCRHYFDCKDKKSVSLCCPDGFSFQDGTCVDNTTCNDPCPQDATVVTPDQSVHNLENSDCGLIPVDGGRKFKQKNKPDKSAMDCSGALLFNVRDCVCTWPPVDKSKQDDAAKRGCKYDVCIDFEKDQVTNIDELHIKKQGGRGYFNGSSALGISIYKDNTRYMNNIALSFLFNSKPDSGPVRQVLVSNCRTKRNRGVSPSFAIFTNRDKSTGDKIIFLVQDKDDKKDSIVFDYQPGTWTSVKFSFDGEKMIATTYKYDSQTKEKTDRRHEVKIFKVFLRKGKETLKVGRCLDTDGFVGAMDDVCVGANKCLMVS